MSANFTPTMHQYTDLTPFRFWCQKILPLAYDDSLSYYELLCKVVDYLNKTMEDVTLSIEDVENLHSAYVALQGYVNNYFNNLDVQEEINNKLDALVADGTIHTIFTPDVMAILNVAQQASLDAIATIPAQVSTWLGEHVSPETGYVIDDTLTISGAAADAKAAGDAIGELKSEINGFTDTYNDTIDDINTALQAEQIPQDITSSLTWVEGKYLNVGGYIDTYASLSYAVVGFALKGEKYNFNGLRGMGSGRAITLIDATGIINDAFTLISTTPDEAGYYSGDYTVPQNGIIVITANTSYYTNVVAIKYVNEYSVVAKREDVSAIEEYILFVPPDRNLINYNTLTNGYINGQGSINSASATNQEKTSANIPVNPTDTYKIICDVPATTGSSWAAVGFWDANDNFLGRYTTVVTEVDNMSHAELTIRPASDTSITNAAYMRVSWRSYGTQLATCNDVTYLNSNLADYVINEINGKNKEYHINGNINMSRTGFDIVQLGFSPLEVSGKYTQGMAVYNDVIFQGYGNGTIDLIDLQTGELINSYAASAGHAGSLSFSNVYPDGNTQFPYLYVASFNENKTFVYNVNRTACTLEKTYLIPTEIAGYCQETCIDKTTGILWCIGHKVNSYNAGDSLIISAWDLSQAEISNDMYVPTDILHYDLPWIPYLQAVQVLNGQLFVIFGGDGSTSDLLTHVVVINCGENAPKANINEFPAAILAAEPEGIDFIFNEDTWKYEAIFATRRSVHYYRIIF